MKKRRNQMRSRKKLRTRNHAKRRKQRLTRRATMHLKRGKSERSPCKLSRIKWKIKRPKKLRLLPPIVTRKQHLLKK